MLFNQILQREIAKGKNEQDANKAAHIEYARHQRQALKNRNIFGSKEVGLFRV